MSKEREDDAREDRLKIPRRRGSEQAGMVYYRRRDRGGVALLYAPNSGKDTRHYIARQTEKGRQIVNRHQQRRGRCQPGNV